MFWDGKHAKAYILYELGLDPRDLLKCESTPPHEELCEKSKQDFILPIFDAGQNVLGNMSAFWCRWSEDHRFESINSG